MIYDDLCVSYLTYLQSKWGNYGAPPCAVPLCKKYQACLYVYWCEGQGFYVFGDGASQATALL